MRVPLVVVLVAAFSFVYVAHGAEKKFGIEGKPAPEWDDVEWVNLSDGQTTPDVKDFEGKVLYVTFFQTMCGGCHQHGLPALNEAIEEHKDDTDVAFVAIQTAFERFDKNDQEGAINTAEQYGLSIPVGHQGKPGTPAPILWTYDAGGTPWTIIIDRKGIVRFNGNRITGELANQKIDELLAE